MIFFVIAAVFCSFSNLIAQEEMSAEDAIRIGLKNNYDIRIARNNAKIADNESGKGTAGFLPTVDLSGSALHSRSDQETNSPFSFGESTTRALDAQISLQWTLFDGFRMFANKRLFSELAKRGEYQARQVIEGRLVAILEAYYNLVQQELLLEVVASNLSISEDRLEKERVRRELGGVSSTDFLNAQVAFNNDKADFLNQQLQVTIAVDRLNVLLGQQPSTEIIVQKEIEVIPLAMGLGELVERVKTHNSDIMIAEQNRILAEQEAKIARSAFLPRIFLTANYGYSDRLVSSNSARFEEDIETQSTDGSIGLTVSYNLFNGFRDKIDSQNARLQVENQELALADQRNELEGLLLQKYEQFNKRLALIELEEQNVRAAEQNLALQQDRYDIGTATSLEFRDAQVNLAQARTLLIVARFQARITRIEIEQLTGSLEIK